MSDKEEIISVTDPTVPNAGRIYDYLLGGNYNYEVDRKIAEELIQTMPIFQKTAKMIRWFLGNAIDSAFKMGFTQFIDFASGLPIVDQIHTRIPEEIKSKTKIIYSDIDPITVQIGNSIIGNNLNIKFLECDCRNPEKLLNSYTVNNLIDKNHKIAFGLNGILYFLTDEQIKNILKIIFDWAPAESIIYFCDYDYNIENTKDKAAMSTVFKYYENIKQPIFFRSKKKVEELIEFWKSKKPGLQIIEKWLEVELDISNEAVVSYGGSMYGGFLEK